MRGLKITENVYHNTLCLLDKYIDINMPPVDYLHLHEEDCPHQDDEYEIVVELFLTVVYHMQFLTDVTNYFYCLGKRRNHSDRNKLMILSQIIISSLNNANKNNIIEILKEENPQKMINLLRLFSRNSITNELLIVGCKYFEEDYVLENIISNVKENKDLFQNMLLQFQQHLQCKREETQLEVTTPVPPNFTVPHRPPPPPPNTPKEEQLSPPKPVPESTYKKPGVNEILTVLKIQNKGASLRLLQAANKAAENLPVARGKQHICPPDPELQSAPARHRIVHKEDVPVKKNAATILREACRVIKEEEQKIQRLNELLGGAANHGRYEELMEEVRADEEQAKLNDIERKHLLGQLTREEAILARHNLLETNKARKAQIDLEKKKTEEILRQMRQEHTEKMKDMIEKTQQIQKNIVENKKNLMNEKHKNAQEVADTSRYLYEKAVLKQREELEKRIEIIKEIKALSRLKDFEENRFDPTETMNIGLLCEMSLAELQERLLINRTSLEEEIQRRRKCIRSQRQKQQQFLSDAEQFVEACRLQKKMIDNAAVEKPKMNKIVQERADIVELREKLQKARSKRMELNKN